MKTISLATIVSLCLLAAPAAAVEFPNGDVPSNIGVELHMSPGYFGDWSEGWDDYIPKLDLIQQAGIGVVRTCFDWRVVEPTLGAREWDFYDQFVTACADRGIRVKAGLFGPNGNYGWNDDHTIQYGASDPAYYGTADFRNGYAAFAGAVAARYSNWKASDGSDIEKMTFELWNEPNSAWFWPGDDTTEAGERASANKYAAMAVQVSQSIRQNDPNATIVAPALSWAPETIGMSGFFLDECLGYRDANNVGMLDVIDGLSVHPYRYTNPETVTNSVTDQASYAYLRSKLAGTSVKLISGEWGYTMGWPGISAQLHADYVAREMLTNFSQGIPYSIWYDFQDNIPDSIGVGPNFGLLALDGTKKPAYHAMQALTSNLKDCTFWDKWNDGNSDHWTLRFRNNANGEERMAVWSTKKDAYGNEIGEIVALPNGLGTTYLNSTPLYLGPVQHLDSGSIWSTATWSNSTNGVWVDKRQASFNANTTVDVNTPVTVSGLQFAPGSVFGSSNSTLTNNSGNGRLRIGLGGAAIHVPKSTFGSATATIYAPLVNENEDIPCNPAACHVRKTGAGTLVLRGANTFSGNLIIAEGTVTAANARALEGPVVTLNNNNCLSFASGINNFNIGGLAGTGNLTLTNVSTLTMGYANYLTFYSGALSGNTSLVKVGTGDQVLSGNNTYTGPITVNQGSIVMGHVNALGNAYNAIALSGGSLNLGGFNLDATHALTISSCGGLCNSATTPSVVYSTPVLNSDFFVCGTGNMELTSVFGSDQFRTLAKSDSGTLTVSGGGGAGADNVNLLLHAYAGKVVLNKESFYNSQTDEQCHAFSQIGSIDPEATVQYAGSGDYQVFQGGSITLNGGTIDFNGHNQDGTVMAITAARSTIANTSADFSWYKPSSIVVNSAHQFTTNNAGFVVNVAPNSILNLQSSIICDTDGGTVWPSLYKTGSGALMLEGQENNTDLTLIVQEGIVAFNRASSPTVHTAVATDIGSGAKLQYATYGGDYQLAPDPGYWVHLSGGTLDFYGANQIGTAMTVATAGSTLANGLANTTSVYTPNSFNYQQNFMVNTVGDLEINGGIVGNSTNWPLLTKTGAGTLTLSGTADNTYTTLVASEGTVKLNKTNTTWGLNAATAVAVNAGATVQYTGTGDYQVAPGNWINLQGGTLDLNGKNQADIAFNVISGYTGSTLANTSTAASTFSPSSIALHAQLNVNNVGDLTINGNITGASGLTKSGSGTLYLNGADNSQWTGTSIITGGNIRLASVPGGSSTIRPNSGGAVIAAGAYSTIMGWLQYGHLSVASTGALAFDGNGTSSETINMGLYGHNSLSLGAVGNCSYSGAITPVSNTYRFGGGGGTLTVTSTLVNNGSTARSLAVNGNVTLTGANTYTGGTTVNGGTLRLSGSGRINSTSGITLNAGGTLLQNSSTALNRSITFSGGTLGGTATYTKPTSGGTLTIGNGSHLSPGDPTVNSGNGLGVGTFTISGSGSWTLGMNSSTVLDFDFGTSSGISDLLQLSGGTSRKLVLDGTLNISCAGTLVAGEYTIFSGFSSYTDNGLLFGSVPAGHTYSYRIDNGAHTVIVTAAPEPGSILILATALLSLAAYAWKRGRKDVK